MAINEKDATLLFQAEQKDSNSEWKSLLDTFDLNHDGRVNWQDFIEFFKNLLKPEELAIIIPKLIPIINGMIDLLTLPLPSIVTLIIKTIVDGLLTELSLHEKDSAERKIVLTQVSHEDLTGKINNELVNNCTLNALIVSTILKNPKLRAEIDKQVASDPEFQKELAESLRSGGRTLPPNSAIR